MKNKFELIRKQINEYWSTKNHAGYYAQNIIKIIFGQKPSDVSADNRLVHSYFYHIGF